MNVSSRKNRISGDMQRWIRRRRGVILLIVLAVVVALSVVAYGFSRQMLIELATTTALKSNIQQELLVDSVVEQILSIEPSEIANLCPPLDENPGSRMPASGKDLPLGANPCIATFEKRAIPNGASIMAVTASSPLLSPRQFGLQNESAKLNLNSLSGKRLSRQQVIAKLMKYKDLSESTAEGIAGLLGVFDSKDPPVNSSQPGSQKPGVDLPLRSLKQLLSVTGVTEERLLGEDRNENGILDPNEDDGDLSWPSDNADGRLDAGWSAHWTLLGAESHAQANGKLKLDLNQTDLSALYDQLLEFATPEEARFVVAWRVSSPIYTDSSKSNEEDAKREGENELKRTFEDRLANQLGSKPNQPTGIPESSGPKFRAGIDLGVTSAREVKSLLEFSSCQLQLLIDGKDTILVSPFANDPTSLGRWLPLWEARTRLTSGRVNEARINILQASIPTLTTVEGISEELAKAIVAQRVLIDANRLTSQSQDKGLTVGWLLEAGLVTTSELRMISDEITVGGSVLRGFAVGQLERSRTAAVRFIELDGRGSRLKLRRSIDLPPLSSSDRL